MNPYLFFDGECEEAMQFYAKCFNGKLLAAMKYGDNPGCEGMDEAMRSRIMHAAVAIGDKLLMASDCPPGRYEKPQGVSISLDYDTSEEVDRVFGSLAENGEVQMPLAETFWATRFGMVTDRFGIPWMVGANKKQAAA